MNDLLTEYGFTSRRYESETGLWYFRARYYNSELGRFISRDPAGFVDGPSLYAGYFAAGWGVDPTGMREVLGFDKNGDPIYPGDVKEYSESNCDCLGTGDKQAEYVGWVQVYVDQPGEGGDRDPYEDQGGDVGHVFWEVRNKLTGEYVGKHGKYANPRPGQGLNPLKGRNNAPGIIKDDKNKDWDVVKSFKLTQGQYDKLKKYIEEQKAKTDRYNTNTSNCADYVIYGLKIIGITLKDTQGKWPSGGGSNPGDLGEDLREIGGLPNFESDKYEKKYNDIFPGWEPYH